MRGVMMHAPGDVRVEDACRTHDRRADRRHHPAHRHLHLRVRPVALPRHRPSRAPTPMGHEYVGIVEEVGGEVTTIKAGDFVVGSFFASDNTCEICRAGYQSRCVHAQAHRRDRHPGRVRPHPAGRRHPGRDARARPTPT